MLAGEQQMPPIWEAFGVVEDCAAALSTEPPLPPYVVIDRFDEPVWLFDSLDEAVQFVNESAAWGFVGDAVTFAGALSREQQRAAREILQ